MPAVFVHGVPDTQRVWRALITRLRRDDVVTLSLPGFGCEIPPGFDCSKEAYCDWLLRELDNIDRPIDLVVAPTFGSRLASRTGARFVSFPDCSHWWQLQRAGEVAKELEALWS